MIGFILTFAVGFLIGAVAGVLGFTYWLTDGFSWRGGDE